MNNTNNQKQNAPKGHKPSLWSKVDCSEEQEKEQKIIGKKYIGENGIDFIVVFE